MSTDPSTLNKLPKLHKSSDYIQWKRLVYVFIRREDPSLISLSFQRSNDAEIDSWKEKSAKAKSVIILCLSDAILAKTRNIVDDDTKSAKDLWDELKRMFTTSSQQEITNLVNRLKSLSFDEKRLWDSHVSEFMGLIDELAAYDQEVTEEEKVSKLIRSLPRSFEPLAIVLSMTKMAFDQLVSSVHAAIARRKGQESQARPVQDESPAYARFAGRFGNRGHRRGYNFNGGGRGRGGFRGGGGFRGRGRGFGGNVDTRVCHYCGMSGHFFKHCRIRIADEGGGGIRKPAYGGQSGRGFVGSSSHQQRQGWNNSYGTPRGTSPWGGSNGQAGQGNNPNAWHSTPSTGPSTKQNLGPFGARSATIPGRNGQTQMDDPGNNPHQARMAKRKLRSNVAKIAEKKDCDAYIDSGATHNFFHSKSSFSTYSTISPEIVQAARGETTLIGKGTVVIPIAGGIVQEAYHAPGFSSHTIAAHLLSDHFEVLMSSSISGDKGCFIFKKGSFSPKDIVWSTPCRDGLYKVITTLGDDNRKGALFSSVNGTSYADWHAKVGHVSSNRYQELSVIREDVPSFARSITDSFECVQCLTAKMQKSPFLSISQDRTEKCEEVHFDISGKLTPRLGGSTYASHFLEPNSAKSDVFFLTAKSELTGIVLNYIDTVESRFSPFGYCVRRLLCDNAGEKLPTELISTCSTKGIEIKTSIPFAPESNGLAEALFHANWLRNRLPSSRIGGDLPIQRWNLRTFIDLQSFLPFGQPGYSFIYRSSTVAGRKVLPRLEFSCFVAVESDSRIIRVFIPSNSTIRTVRRTDFHPTNEPSILPSINSLVDGLSRQASLEANEDVPDGVAEEDLSRCLSTVLIPQKGHLGTSDGPPLPVSFEAACADQNWAAAIDREYDSLVHRGTWRYVQRTPDMQPVPLKWPFKAKQLDNTGEPFLYKARFVPRGDLQEPFEDFDPENLYAPVATHESLRLFLEVCAALKLVPEGADVNSAYLHGKIDVPMIMEQPTNSTQHPAKPNFVCLLERSIYGARQAGIIWGSLLDNDLQSWGFQVS